MEIIKADKSHKKYVLTLLDDFRTACNAIIDPKKKYVSTTAKDNGGSTFDSVINSPSSAIFLAKEGNDYIGIVTIYKIPQIRKGEYCGEIEEMYVNQKYQGKGVAQLLIDAVIDWAKKEGMSNIRLESSIELKRAHRFYEKAGFSLHTRGYEKKI